MRIICVNTGNKYSQWYTDNLKYMIDKHSNLKYTSFEIIDEVIFGGVYDKLQMFDRFRDGQNLYFDLDVVIRRDCNDFIHKDLTVCHAHWRAHGDFYERNPINSSVISWYGDKSHIFNFFNSNVKELIKEYDRGIDEFLWQVYRPKKFADKLYNSIQREEQDSDVSVCLFNQSHELMLSEGWWSNYLLQSQSQL